MNITVPQLDANFKLPQYLEGANYGEKKGESSDVAIFKGHEEQLKPMVIQLAELEDKVQKSYWTLKAKWNANNNNNNNNNNNSSKNSDNQPKGERKK